MSVLAVRAALAAGVVAVVVGMVAGSAWPVVLGAWAVLGAVAATVARGRASGPRPRITFRRRGGDA